MTQNRSSPAPGHVYKTVIYDCCVCASLVTYTTHSDI